MQYQRRLAGPVVAGGGHPELRDHRRDVHDRAVTAGGHARHQRCDQQVGRFDVDREHLVDVPGLRVRGGAEGEDARAVDQDIDVATAQLGRAFGE
ncbi:hypothetical protein GCM10023175_54200 [Pseudonocardia xishanensis]|uniref:Uncharacterized protein n=1 Tax=Pseudonocardia xishanensis TaxID=630995 RepID=A0ABP8S170_9PSEU